MIDNMKKNSEIKFYEGKFQKSIEDLSLSKNYLKPLFYKLSVTQDRSRVFNKFIDNSNKNLILDLGCGGGREIIKNKGKVVGIDISFSSLSEAKKIYENVILADVQYLPFKNNTFDVICSFDVVGHIPKEHKKSTIQEVERILKTGALTLYFIETESKCKLLHFAKTYCDLYRKYFILQDGHFGLETPSSTVNRFNEFFEVLNFGGLYYNIWDSGEYLKRFDNEYKSKTLMIKLLVYFSKLAELNLICHVIANTFIGIIQKYEQFKMPFDDASLIFGLGHKR